MATKSYEDARGTVARFLNARFASQIIFTHGTTEALNMVAYSWARNNIPRGGLIVLGIDNHHSNIVPWQMLAAEQGLEIAFITVGSDGSLDQQSYLQLLERNPRLVSISGMSNVCGSILPLIEWCDLSHRVGAAFVVDASQLAAHQTIDISACNPDFLAFSGHKTYAPTGIGVLYARLERLDEMVPFMGGGEMIERVSLTGFTPAKPPRCFEAGTPAVTQAIGLAAALTWLEALGFDNLISHEYALYNHTIKSLAEVRGLSVLGAAVSKHDVVCPVGKVATKKGGMVSFTLEGIHPHDIAQLLDQQGIAVRAGHHCAMPFHGALGIPASVRASFGAYTSHKDIDCLAEALIQITQRFKRGGTDHG
jgi:cysteine desulfurase/selenocysteine lyase